MSHAADRARWIEQLFPREIVSYALDEQGHPPALMPEEEISVKNAVAKRRLEFARGRACARLACRDLGRPHQAIPKGSERAPIWPSGLTGSITHCPGLVAAIVARASSYAAVGIDAEPRETLASDIAARIGTQRERAQLNDLAEFEPEVRGRLLFSAKEVVHKCIQPLTGTFLDFLDVFVHFEVDQSRFTVEPMTRLAGSIRQVKAISGRYCLTDEHLIAVGWIDAGDEQI
jgi:4'-phosphopantetheinyl transferase EntD